MFLINFKLFDLDQTELNKILETCFCSKSMKLWYHWILVQLIYHWTLNLLVQSHDSDFEPKMTEKWTISNQNTDLPLEKCKNWKFLVKINEFQCGKTPILWKTTSYNFQFRQQNVKRNHFFQNQRDFRVKTPTFQKSTNS